MIGLLAVFLVGRLGVFFYPCFEPNGDDPANGVGSYFMRMTFFTYTVEFFASAVGGYIAREKFVVPAVLFQAALFTYGVLFGLSMAADSSHDQVSNSNIFSELSMSALLPMLAILLIGSAVAAAGSIAGMKLFATMHSSRFDSR